LNSTTYLRDILCLDDEFEVFFHLLFKVIDMPTKQHVEIFSAGCALCQDLIETVRDIACSACEVEVLDLTDPDDAKQARNYEINSAPAVVVDGEPVSCCKQDGPDADVLRAAGIGSAGE